MNSNFLNRELSWISFNKRVLEEAFNKNHPVLERVNFLSISGSNLDEFFMVRVSGLKGQIDENIYLPSIDDLLPEESLKMVLLESKKLKEKQNQCWMSILSELKKNKIEITNFDKTSKSDKVWLKNYFSKNVFPLLTPVAVDPAHPFPFVPNLGLCMVLKLKNFKRKKLIKVVIPFAKGLNKFIKIKNTQKFIKTEDLIIKFISDLFSDCKYISYGTFRIIRDSDIEFIDEAEDLVTTFENQLRQRRYGRVTLLEISKNMPKDLKSMIVNFDLAWSHYAKNVGAIDAYGGEPFHYASGGAFPYDFQIAQSARFTRAEFLRIRSLEFVQAAESLGYSAARTIFKHALPNSLAPVFVSIAFGIASAILIESGLSFLGIGVPTDIVTWGSLLNLGRQNLEAWWLIIYPGMAIFLTITIYNMIAEASRDALDPRLKD